jgi:hypothetical protein
MAGAFTLLGILFGDNVNVTVMTEGTSLNANHTLDPRYFTSINTIATEIAVSRMYGGVNFFKAIVDGEVIGMFVALDVQYYFKKALSF